MGVVHLASNQQESPLLQKYCDAKSEVYHNTVQRIHALGADVTLLQKLTCLGAALEKKAR